MPGVDSQGRAWKPAIWATAVSNEHDSLGKAGASVSSSKAMTPRAHTSAAAEALTVCLPARYAATVSGGAYRRLKARRASESAWQHPSAEPWAGDDSKRALIVNEIKRALIVHDSKRALIVNGEQII